MIIETTRLLLRAVQIEDAASLSELMSTDVSGRLASWPAPLSPSMATQRIADIQYEADRGLAMPMVITRKSDGAMIGWFSAMTAAGDPSTALLTYWVGNHFQGLGYMREGAMAALGAAFDCLQVQRVRAAVQPDNPRSIKVLESLGLAKVGEGRIWCPARSRDEECFWFEAERQRVLDRQLVCSAAL